MPSLFPNDSDVELLPRDGSARYFGTLFTAQESARLFAELKENIRWEHETVRMFGKEIVMSRMVAWYGERPFDYAYSGYTRKALVWTATLMEIKARIESCSGADFNACLLNFYHHGGEGMGWHSDDEKELDPYSPIASVSLGAERRFSFRHKAEGSLRHVLLENGSLLLMDAASQRHWLHALPKSKRVQDARINLTFRKLHVAPLNNSAG